MGTIAPATAGQIETARGLFVEYAESLGISLCFQNFSRELAALPGDYAAPTGELLLAWMEGNPAGCVAVRRLDPETCEMKRLYVRPSCRAAGLGRALALSILKTAKELGYRRMRLDTLPSMQSAIALYRSLGFREIAPYRENPVPGALYLEIDLEVLPFPSNIPPASTDKRDVGQVSPPL